ncbi:MlaD family protein [Desulfobulbus propionicus]
MSKKANPTLIGTFVLTALVITIAAVVILGKITFRDDRFRCVAYFTGSLFGLDVGAPVTFRGVIVGRVSEVRINYDKEHNNYVLPVFIDIEQTTSLTGIDSHHWDPQAIKAMLTQMIDHGLRAQLKITSFLTGKLYIELALHPDSAAPLHGRAPDLLEIPTMPSGLEQITQKLENLPLTEILNKAAIALDGINSIINSQETRRAIASADDTLDRLNKLLAQADAQFPAIAKELKKGLTNFAALSHTADTLLRTADKELPGLSGELQQLMGGLNQTATALTKTLTNLEQLTSKDSLFGYQIRTSLREIEQAAVSIRQLTDYLQQNPNALVFGQGEDKP